MSHGPLPTALVFLSDLPSIPAGSKVRFLGWLILPSSNPKWRCSLFTYSVTKYSTPTGMLDLRHTYPPPAIATGSVPEVTAMVDVNLLLSSLKATDTQTGEWVNVIGYVDPNDGERIQIGKRSGNTRASTVIRVQAVMVWSAGAIKIEEYEKAVMGRNGPVT
ncbi:MAG: hypothetical protein Q9187_006168 [Circinaria calcarea]